MQLKYLQDVGEIRELRCQVPFDLFVPGTRGPVKIGKYVADFSYRRGSEYVVEDAKGFATPLYKWKKKHAEAQFGITVRDV